MNPFRQTDEQKAEREAAKLERFRRRQAAGEERQAAADERKAFRDGLKEYVHEHRQERIASFLDVHLFPASIIRLPGFASSGSTANWTAAPERFPIAGVRASVDTAGGVSARSTLTRTMVPGAHGWQKKVDTRETWLTIEGPGFGWAILVPTALAGSARQFAAKVTGISNSAIPVPQSAPPAGIADELQKLAGLRDAGVLTPQEFETAKARLLSGSGGLG